MDSMINNEKIEIIRKFELPRYGEIPDVGLYLEQTCKYISGYLEPLGNISITSTMISNYVKMGLVSNPVKKQYNREQIAYIMYIAVAKNVLSLEHIQLMLELRKKSYDSEVAYEYFRLEFKNVLQYVFGIKDELEAVGVDNTSEKTMLRNTIITVAHKVYLDMCFSMLEEIVTEKKD